MSKSEELSRNYYNMNQVVISLANYLLQE